MQYASLREKIRAEKIEREQRYQKFAAAVSEAVSAGNAAAEACVPTPMVVSQHANPLDDNSRITKQWYVASGVCGSALLLVRPATCSFARWAVKTGLGCVSRYHGGVSLHLHPASLTQSYEVNCAFAHAAAAVLRAKLSLTVYVHEYLD